MDGPAQQMGLRDWFAGQALNGLAMQNNELLGKARELHPEWSAQECREHIQFCVASSAYEFADAMLAERAKEK